MYDTKYKKRFDGKVRLSPKKCFQVSSNELVLLIT